MRSQKEKKVCKMRIHQVFQHSQCIIKSALAISSISHCKLKACFAVFTEEFSSHSTTCKAFVHSKLFSEVVLIHQQ